MLPLSLPLSSWKLWKVLSELLPRVTVLVPAQIPLIWPFSGLRLFLLFFKVILSSYYIDFVFIILRTRSEFLWTSIGLSQSMKNFGRTSLWKKLHLPLLSTEISCGFPKDILLCFASVTRVYCFCCFIYIYIFKDNACKFNEIRWFLMTWSKICPLQAKCLQWPKLTLILKFIRSWRWFGWEKQPILC